MTASERGDTVHGVVHETASAGTDTIEIVRGRATTTGGGTVTEMIGAGIGHEAASTSDERNDLSDEQTATSRTRGQDQIRRSHGESVRRGVGRHTGAREGGTEGHVLRNTSGLSCLGVL
jgi:hypothetical protein